MSATCDAAAEQITADLGFSCHDTNPVVTFRNPWDLANRTMPFLELLIIAGAVFALVHAVRRKRQGDPTNLALWFASLVYLFVTEPPLYFPGWFGLQDAVGTVFVHNVFTVQFMFDRLPLYIVAIYPAMSQLAYKVVRTLGVFRRRGALVGAVCVALVCQAFYEIFDQLGPQLTWWAWNLDNDANHPMLDTVPVNSILLFSSVSFGVLTYLVVRLVGPDRDGLVWRTVLAGALAPVGMTLANLPTAPLTGHVTAQAVVLTVELVLLWGFGCWVLWTESRGGREQVEPFVRFYPAVYLVVFVVLWATELPDVTGNVPYTLLCFGLAGWTAHAAGRASSRLAVSTTA